ncbi:MAG TPA: WbqC family protein [Bacteroidales bacterium]|nr:WbqC family protein [Bacteroidales bacterium]
MAGKILVSTAYLPPVAYFSLISDVDEVLIEKEENYLKQTYRNRCYILSANGIQSLSVPVLLGSFHKTVIKNIRIDYSRRWQQVHLRALSAAYRASPYFEYYFEAIERIISARHEYLLDLNMELTTFFLESVKMKRKIKYTSHFAPVKNNPGDFRYNFSPKKEFKRDYKEYLQVFSERHGFVPGLSIADLLFNTGPDAPGFL